MERNDAILKLKETIKNLLKFTEGEKKFTDVLGKDGSKYVTPADKLDIGVMLYLLDDKGNQTIPEPNTPIILDDGSTVTVDATGLVTDIQAPQQTKDGESTPVEDAQMTIDPNATPEDTAVDTEDVDVDKELIQRIDDLETAVGQILSMLGDMSMSSENTAKKVEETFSKLEKLSAEPAEQSIKNKKIAKESFMNKKFDFTSRKEDNEVLNLKEAMKKIRLQGGSPRSI